MGCYFIYLLRNSCSGSNPFYLGFLALLPLAIHGSYRYRMSRTSWRGIRFGYRGDRKEFTLNFFKWILLTIVTLGFYSFWMSINMRRYVLGNVRFGDAEFNYSGDGNRLFLLYIKVTFDYNNFGIYMFWWQKDLFDYLCFQFKFTQRRQRITVDLYGYWWRFLNIRNNKPLILILL